MPLEISPLGNILLNHNGGGRTTNVATAGLEPCAPRAKTVTYVWPGCSA
jgi:hypothetical protein